jgi:hypothetical protein
MNLQEAVAVMRSSKSIKEWNANRDKVRRAIPEPTYTTLLQQEFIADKKGKVKKKIGNRVLFGYNVEKVKVVVSKSNAIPIIGYIDGSGLIDQVLPQRRKEHVVRAQVQEQKMEAEVCK